ncbi:2-oxo-4-hydroxy-4-carboxy-5-ureidoimidazoline decarboxylase [Paenibacillus sp. NPDC058071]|uniref:2-oxo-4-hydroxy-4-carboxy-5-ureidoimidazoline decarboxylase n=1 Tax=Paenibacillus sp. NPDC058071 TaxID=3346326 RepID=UPI0036DDEF4E
MKLIELNEMNQNEFTEALGAIFEHSPWVANQTWPKRPFATREELHEAMIETVRHSDPEKIVAFLRQHPDLGTRISMAEYSTKEQHGAGLDQLSPDEFERFAEANRRYTERFGFPFIYAVRGKGKNDIWLSLEQRIGQEREEEIAEALRQISRITGFRISDLVVD